MMSSFAGRYVSPSFLYLPTPSIPSKFIHNYLTCSENEWLIYVQYHRYRRNRPPSPRRPQDQAPDKPRSFPRQRRSANRPRRGIRFVQRMGMDSCAKRTWIICCTYPDSTYLFYPFMSALLTHHNTALRRICLH